MNGFKLAFASLFAAQLLLVPGVGSAGEGGGEAQTATERASERRDRLDALAADRAAYVAGILSDVTDLPPEAAEELAQVLAERSDDELLAARDLTTREGVLEAAGIRPLVIGDGGRDLVFFPVTPCRLFDTRLAGGALVPNIVRTLGVNGTLGNPGDLSGQGGDPSNCTIPVDPAAVMVTLTAVTPDGPGNLRAFAAGGAVPLASALNYRATPTALANTTVIPVCMGCGTGIDIDVRADVSGTHLVGDIVGYFWSPNATPLQCVTVQASLTFGNGSPFSLASGTCPAGYTMTSGGNEHTGPPTGLWWQSSTLSGGQWVTSGRNETGASVTVTANGVCCRIPGR